MPDLTAGAANQNPRHGRSRRGCLGLVVLLRGARRLAAGRSLRTGPSLIGHRHHRAQLAHGNAQRFEWRIRGLDPGIETESLAQPLQHDLRLGELPGLDQPHDQQRARNHQARHAPTAGITARHEELVADEMAVQRNPGRIGFATDVDGAAHPPQVPHLAGGDQITGCLLADSQGEFGVVAPHEHRRERQAMAFERCSGHQDRNVGCRPHRYHAQIEQRGPVSVIDGVGSLVDTRHVGQQTVFGIGQRQQEGMRLVLRQQPLLGVDELLQGIRLGNDVVIHHPDEIGAELVGNTKTSAETA